MSKGSPHFQKLKQEFIFPIIEQKLEEFRKQHPNKTILNFGIGDVVFPLNSAIVESLVQAVQEMGTTVRGYGPPTGYSFLKEALVDYEYGNYGISPHEIFISEGTKADSVNLLDLFATKCSVAITDPTYPSYLDGCILDGRTSSPTEDGLYQEITYLPCLEENGFAPLPPNHPCHIVYLCSPNNPTGIALTKEQLSTWVAYAKKHQAILIVDAAYEAFISSPNTPRSIYEIPGALEVAIELRSFSKSAGFTGLRCAYAVIPDKLYVQVHQKKMPLNTLWKQRQNIKSNGVAYPIQKAAAYSLQPHVQKELRKNIEIYLTQSKRVKEALLAAHQTCYGGIDCPYIWWKAPQELSSWEFFDKLLHQVNLLTIPGSAFGRQGEGFVRLSAFATPDTVDLALPRLSSIDFL